jgi:hypothetical protein
MSGCFETFLVWTCTEAHFRTIREGWAGPRFSPHVGGENNSLRLSSQGRPLPTLQVLRPQWVRWFDLARQSDLNLVKWRYQLRSFNVRQDFGQRQRYTSPIPPAPILAFIRCARMTKRQNTWCRSACRPPEFGERRYGTLSLLIPRLKLPWRVLRAA